MEDSEVELEYSRHNRLVTVGDKQVEVYIYRAVLTQSNDDPHEWTLEVVNSENVSWVWDEQFETDDAANNEFSRVLVEDGVEVFFASE